MAPITSNLWLLSARLQRGGSVPVLKAVALDAESSASFVGVARLNGLQLQQPPMENPYCSCRLTCLLPGQRGQGGLPLQRPQQGGSRPTAAIPDE